MMDLVQRVNWNEYFVILTQGHPPLALQLLVVNAMLTAFWLVRRARKRKHQSSALLLQLLFLAGNLGVVTFGNRLSF